MTYRETIELLYNQLPVFHRIGKAAYKANLNNTIALDDYFGHPHRKYITIHIAGTNGKGSVSHMIASVLQEAGYRTALYTSPHLKDFRERIKINGEMIPENKVVEFVADNMEIINRINPSFFELSVAMAFNYFESEEVEVAVIETGLGGRLDSTNIIEPVLSVITNIGYDHMDLLGDTIEKIAVEKAGIIKKNIPVIIGETSDLTAGIFINKAADMACEIMFADSRYTCWLKEMDNTTGEREFELMNLLTGDMMKGKSALGGDYQSKNIPVVAASVDVIGSLLKISEKEVLSGIENVKRNTGLMGRWQIIGQNPLIICDTGHNKDGLGWVMKQLEATKGKYLHMVIGFVKDKDLSNLLPLFPTNAKYYFTKASVPRALNEADLKEAANSYGLYGDSYDTVQKALEAAKSNCGKEDVIFIGGSTFVVGEVI
jgi:dihydrofolate synthase / folylpolyglutamate synthase